jgi:transposase
MQYDKLSHSEITELKARHRVIRDAKECDRIKAVLLYDKGWSTLRIAQALLLDDSTISRHLREYHEQKKLNIDSGGAHRNYLDSSQTEELMAHLEETLYAHNRDIVAHILETYQVLFTVSGLHKWLHHHGFVYKKPKGVPRKTDRARQEAFIATYKALKSQVQDNEHIVFLDAVHPTQATKLAYGWIKKGQDKAVLTTGSRTRLNIVGGIELTQLSKAVIRQYDTINSSAMCDYLGALREAYGTAPLHAIVDGAGYHRAEEFKTKAKELNICLHYLPPYSPNLNPIERLWKVMNKEVRNNRFFSTPREFKAGIAEFFDTRLAQISDNLDSWINDNFEVMGS